MKTQRLAVAVMHCEKCVANVMKHYETLDGIESIDVDLPNQLVTVVYDPGLINTDDLLHALDDTDFKVAIMPEEGKHPFAHEIAEDAAQKEREASKKAQQQEDQKDIEPEETEEVQPAKIRLAIEGMHCANCSATIESHYKKTPGVIEVAVNLANNTGKVIFDPRVASVDDMLAVFNDLAFSAELIPEDAPLIDEARREREMLRAKHDEKVFACSAVLTLLIVAICMIPGWHMAIGTWLASIFTPDPTHAQTMFAVNILLMIMTIPVQFICGARFYKGAYGSLKGGSANMDVLVALGTTIAFLFSTYITFLPVITGDWGHGIAALEINDGMPYFETCAMLITFVLLGKMLETRAKGATNQAIESLMNLTPPTATVLRENTEQTIPLAQVVAGDTVLIRPGEKVPVDGVTLEGASEIDESMLTGESMPVKKEQGSFVTGGTQNTTGALKVRALRVGADSTLARIVRAVEDAQGSKAPIQRIADKIASIFVPAILIIALIVFCVWFFFIEPDQAGHRLQQALMPAIAVICVACPCALGLATPTALMVGMGKGAQLSVLIKDGSVLEMMSSLKAAIFDKTGTLTNGTPEVIRSTVSNKALSLAAALETKSEHPLAKAVVTYAQAQGISVDMPVYDFKAVVGEGVRGIVDNHEVFVGVVTQERDAHANRIDIKESVTNSTDINSTDESFATQVVIDGKTCGVLEFFDSPKVDAAQTLATLKNEYDIESFMVTGDVLPAAKRIAAEVGITNDHIFAGIKPIQKAACVDEVQHELNAGAVAFIGDGINDAPALAAADIGVALASGTDIALDAGSVVLMRNRLSDLIVALRLSKATMRKIKQNLFWALIYNCIMIPLAAVGILAPALAGAAMALSSVSVVSNSLLLKRAKLS